MHTVVIFPIGGLCGTTSIYSSAFLKPKIHGKEIADAALHVAFQQSLLKPSYSSIRSEGKRRGRPRRNISSDKTKEADRLNELKTTNNEMKRPSNQDEIITLFGRIQSSIASEGSAGSRRRNSENSSGKKLTERVLGSLQQYSKKKQMKVKSLEEIKGSSPSSGMLEDEEYIKTSRPRSNFVKKSPIPTTLIKGKMAEEQLSETDMDVSSDLQNLDDMKLAELKELVKTKGVKGYSKLKKKEILELIRRFLQSSSS